MYNVLLIEEEKTVRNECCSMLEPYDLFYFQHHSAETALPVVQNDWMDIILLDAPAPSSCWIHLCEKIRRHSAAPIVMVTKSTDKHCIVQILNAGADDVIPYSMDTDILVAKIKAHVRRSSKIRPKELCVHGMILNRELVEIQYEGQLLPFTQKEYAVMEYFLSHPNRVIGREKLLSQLWDGYQHIDARTVDSHIRNIRMKCREAGFPIDDFLRTARGIGYLWKVKMEKPNQELNEFEAKEKVKMNHTLARLN